MPATLPEEVSLDQAKAWFGEETTGHFNPDGAVSQLWVGLGRFPTLKAIANVGDAEFYHFADGSVILRPNAGATPVVIGANPDGGLPAGVSTSQAETWFGTQTTGRFNPTGAVSKLWLTLGRFPALTEIQTSGTVEFYRFADGTVVRRADPGATPERIGAGAGGNLPAGVSTSQVETWFGTETEGRFNPNGPISKLWLGLGRFPTLKSIEKIGDAEYYRFADGTIIFRPDGGTAPKIVPAQAVTTPSGALPIGTIWGGASFTLTQEHGLTPFSQGEGAHFYGYTLAYCRDWCGEPLDNPGATFCPGIPETAGAGHPGLDIGIGFETKLFTPVAGKVVCAGTENGIPGEGCAAFPCIPASGNSKSGRFELELDNGDRLLFGHLSHATVEPGQMLNAGDEVGFSGRDNGDHVHIEYRKSFPECQADAKYLLIDPRDKFGPLP